MEEATRSSPHFDQAVRFENQKSNDQCPKHHLTHWREQLHGIGGPNGQQGDNAAQHLWHQGHEGRAQDGAQHRAQAKAALALAERIEAEQRAEVEAPAKAAKAKVIVEAEAEAEKRRIEAEGEAAANYAKLEAEARGQFEILAKKGEGLKRIIDACGGAQPAFQILMLEHIDHIAQASAQAISNIKFDKVIVWEGGADGDGGGNTSRFLKNLAHTLPPMMQIMKDIGGIELPEFIARFAKEAESTGKPPSGDSDDKGTKR